MNGHAIRQLTRFVVVLCALATCSVSWARSGSDSDAAFSYYESARKLYRAGNFEAAVVEISKAEKLNSLPAYTVFRAWCVYKIGDQTQGISTVKALLEDKSLSRRDRREFQSVLKRMNATAQMVNIAIHSRTRLAQIWLNGVRLEDQQAQQAVPSIVGTQIVELWHGKIHIRKEVFISDQKNRPIQIDLPGGDLVLRNIPAESKVLLNGTDIGTPPDEGWRLVPGSYHLAITMGHVALLAQTVQITTGAEEAILVGVPREARALPRSSRRRWAGLTGAIGVLGLIGAVLVHASADNDLSRAGQAFDSATGKTLHSQFYSFDLYERGHQKIDNATLLYGVSSAMVVGSVLWWFLDHNPSSTTPRSSLFISPTGASMGWSF